ncbi:MAG: hypothetical protein MK137_00765 [Rickettsiales bacterium]|nr:hypothetical protein [Rickettsiales bacterium]
MSKYNLGQGFSTVLKAILIVPLFIIQEVVRAIALVGDYIFKNLADIFLTFSSKGSKDNEYGKASFTIPILGDLIPFILGGIAAGFNKIATAKGFPMVINPPKPAKKGSRPEQQPSITASKSKIRLADAPQNTVSEAISAPKTNPKSGDWARKVQESEQAEQSVLKSA